MARNPNKKRCKAKNRKGEQCKNWAKEGYEVCHYHGARGGAPTNNKNAVKTGEYESIWIDTLEDEEKDLINKIDLDKIKQLNNEIKLTEIRERRMLKRIQGLKESDYTVVSIKSGIEKGQATDIKESEGTLGQIQSIEDALTRVQTHKAKLIDLKHKLELDLSEGEEDAEAIKDFLKATKPSKEDIEELFKEELNEE